jgi:hypothetical protein
MALGNIATEPEEKIRSTGDSDNKNRFVAAIPTPNGFRLEITNPVSKLGHRDLSATPATQTSPVREMQAVILINKDPASTAVVIGVGG